MTLSNTLTSWRKSLPILLRCLAIALAVALVGALAVSASWLMRTCLLLHFPGLRLGLRRRVGDDVRRAGDRRSRP